MISVKNLTAGYGIKPVVSRLSFSISTEASPLVFVGRNGSGKSTLMKALLGQIAFEGSIDFRPKPDSIGWIPQNYHVSIRIPVLDFVAMGTQSTKGFFPSQNSDSVERAQSALAELGISKLATKQTDALSGGEWQLVCLAQLLVQPTDVWLLDEPTSSLDVYHKTRVFEFLWEQAKKGKTVLLSTHDLPFIPSHSGGYLHIHNGLADIGDISAQSIQDLLNALKEPVL